MTLLYFGYTSCPDVCPTHMAAIGRALDELPPEQADDVQVLFATVDPVVDPPEALRSYLDHFGQDSRTRPTPTTAWSARAATPRSPSSYTRP